MPIYRIDGFDIEAASFQEAGDRLDKARKEVESEAAQAQQRRTAEQDSKALMALASLQKTVEQQGSTLGDQQQQITGLGQLQSDQAERIAAVEATVAAIPTPDLARVNEQHSELLTEGSRVLNRAMAATAMVDEREASLIETLDGAEVRINAMADGADASVEAIRLGAQAELTAIRADVSREIESIRTFIGGLEQPNGIVSITQERPESFNITTTDGVVTEVRLPRGPRGFRQPPMSQGIIGGSNNGSGNAAIGAAYDANLTTSFEAPIIFRDKGGIVRLLKGDATVRYRVTSAADATKWSSGTLSLAAAQGLSVDEAFTVGGELYGIGGDLDLAWRVVRNTAPGATDLLLFATPPEDCRLTATIESTTEV